jgi:exosortase
VTGFLLGKEALLRFLFPAAFLLFLVPPPLFLIDLVTSPLKLFLAYVAERFLTFTGYAAGRSGTVLFIGDYSIVVGDACSGLRSLIALMAVGAVYAYLQKMPGWKRGALFLAVIPISVFANFIRLILLALITYYFGEAAGQGFFHYFSGLLLFSIALLSLVLVDVLLDQRRSIEPGE